MGNIGISGRQGRPEQPDAGEDGGPTAGQPPTAATAEAQGGGREAAGPAGPAGRRRNRSRSRDAADPRSPSPAVLAPPPAPPPPPPPPPPLRRSRARSPLGRQRNQGRLVDALFSEAMACSTCQRVGGAPQVSQFSSADVPSSAALSVLSTVSASGSLTPSSRAGVESMSPPEPFIATGSETYAASEGAVDEVTSPRQQVREQGVVVHLASDSIQGRAASLEGVSGKDVPVKDVNSMSEADASSVATDTSSTLTSSEQPPRLATEGGDARTDGTKDSEEDIDVGIVIESTALDGFYFGAMMSVDDKLKTDYFEEVRLRTELYFDASRPADEEAGSAIDEEPEEERRDEIPENDQVVTGDEVQAVQEVAVDQEIDPSRLPVDVPVDSVRQTDVAEGQAMDAEENTRNEELNNGSAEAAADARFEAQDSEGCASPNNTEASSSINIDDVSSRQTETLDEGSDRRQSDATVTDTLTEVDEDSLCSRLAALREQTDTSNTPVSEGDAASELMELARTSMALTAASSSVPDSESVALLEEDEDVNEDVVETSEGAGDDTLVGCDMDLKHVAGGLFDTAGAPPPVQHNTLVKGGSLPAASAATAVVEEQPAASTAGRADRADWGLAALGGFPFTARRRQDKAQRSATASALLSCPEATAPANAPPSQSDEGSESAAGTQSRPRTGPDSKIKFDLKLADVKPVRASAPSTHRNLSDVLQGLKQAILPRKAAGAGRRTIAKKSRSGLRLLAKKEKARSGEQIEPEDVATVELRGAGSEIEQVPDEPAQPQPPEDGAVDETASVLSDIPSLGSHSRRASRKPSEEKNGPDRVKKNHVDPLPTMEIHIRPKNTAVTKSVTSRSKSQEIETHSRSSRVSIAPPRTNFLSEDVQRLLARSSSIKYIDCTQRSNLRASRKTPERYRNVPPPLRRSESGTSDSTTPSKTSTPRPVASKRGYNIRKRMKTSETVICRESSNATINIECLADHKVDNKYYVYTVNDNKATELRLSEMFVLHEEPTANADVPTVAETAASKIAAKGMKAKKTCKPASRRSKRGSASSTSTVRSRDTAAREQSSAVGKKAPVQQTTLFKQKRGGAGEKNKTSERLKGGAGEKKTSSSISLLKRRIEILNRLQQFSPSDCTVEIASDSCTRVADRTETDIQVSEQLPSGSSDAHGPYTGDMFLSDREEWTQPSRDEASPTTRSIGGSFHTKAQGRKLAVPRYRPTIRTPRISCVGMNAGNEGALLFRKEFEIDTRALSRARVPYKHTVKVSHTTFPVSKQKTSKKLELRSTSSSDRNRAALAPFSGLREVTEMLIKYSTLSAASGRSFANVSELVSLFEAPTKASLPSVGNESHGGMAASTRPSIDEVLEEIKRVHKSGGSGFEGEEVQVSEVNDVTSDNGEDNDSNSEPLLNPEEPISLQPAQSTGIKICRIDTEAKVAAALQEILNSLTDLRCAEAEAAENLSTPAPIASKNAEQDISSCEVACILEGSETEKDAECLLVNHANNEDADQTVRKSREIGHLHGLRYKPSKGRSTFDVLEILLTDGCLTVNKEEQKTTQNVKMAETSDRLSRTLKVNTWTLPPVPTVSDSVQATVSTTNADCQRTKLSSPTENSHESFSISNVECKDDTPLENKQKLFEKRKPVPDIQEPNSQSIPPANLTFVNSHALESFDFSDYSPDLIPRSHHNILQMASDQNEHVSIFKSSNTILRRNSSHGNVQTTLQHIGSTQDITPKTNLLPESKLTGFQRAQKRIAGFLEDDVPATVLSVLTEVLPLFLTRTKAELSSSRQTTLQHILFEDYFNHPANAPEDCNPREDPQATLLVGTMVYQISLLVEDAARSAEMELQSDALQPP